MYKYVITWGLFVMGIINWGLPERRGLPGFEKIGSDSAIFYNRDSAIVFQRVLSRNYLTPPHNKRGRVFDIKLDSVFIPQPARKRFLFF